MRARNIKPGLFKNEDLAECSFPARLLFPGLWLMADREGRLEDRVKRIKAELLPYDDVDIDALLNELAEGGFIERYAVDEKRYIQVVNFVKHQNPHKNETPSVIPPIGGNAPEITGAVEKLPEHSRNYPSAPADSLYTDSLNPSSLNPSSLNSSSLNPSSLNPKGRGYSANAENPQTPYEGKGQDKNQGTALSVSRAFIDMFCKRYKAKKGIPHDGINPGKTDMLALGISNLIPRNEWEILIDAYLDKPYERNCNYYIWHFLSIKVLAVLGCGIGYFGREQVFEADGQVYDEETLVETLFAQLDEPLYSAVRLAYGVASE